MKKLNKKGYVTTLSVITIMLISLSFLSVFYTTIQIRNTQIGLSDNRTEQMVKERTVIDRIYGVFDSNFYRTHDIHFNDLEVSYSVEVLSSNQNYRTIQLQKIDSSSAGGNIPDMITIKIEHLNHPSYQPNTPKIEFEVLSVSEGVN